MGREYLSREKVVASFNCFRTIDEEVGMFLYWDDCVLISDYDGRRDGFPRVDERPGKAAVGGRIIPCEMLRLMHYIVFSLRTQWLFTG